MVRKLNQDQAQLVERLLRELKVDDRAFWDSLSQSERQFFREIITELERDGKSVKLRAIEDYDFLRRPPTIQEALDANYTTDDGIKTNYWFGTDALKIYPFWREILLETLDDDSDVFELILTGPIGGGKTVCAVFALVFKLIHMTCLRDPFTYYDLMRSAPIVIHLCNVAKYRAKDTAYAMIEGILNTSPYFREHFPINTRKVFDTAADDEDKYAIQLPRGMKITTGANPDSAISANVVGALLDEMSFKELKTAKSNDYTDLEAFKLYSNIRKRIESRFEREGRKIPSILCNVSSKKGTADFLEQHIKRVRGNKTVYIVDAPIYVMKPEDQFSKETFRVMVGDELTSHRILAPEEPDPAGYRIEHVPVNFRESFDLDLDGSIRDICGIATFGEQPLLRDRGRLAQTINPQRPNPFPEEVVLGTRSDFNLEDLLQIEEVCQMWGTGYRPRHHPNSPRFIHLDLSKTGDATGVVMGCVYDVAHIRRPNKDGSVSPMIVPKIWIDFFLRIKAPINDQIDYQKIRQLIFTFRDAYNYPVRKVSADTYQSTDMLQLLEKAGFDTDTISVDRTDEPYLQARMVVQEMRVDQPEHKPFITEVTSLIHDTTGARGKVDHPPGGSKDIADAWCGVIASIGKEDDVSLLFTSPQMAPLFTPGQDGEQKNKKDFIRTQINYDDLLTDIR